MTKPKHPLLCPAWALLPILGALVLSCSSQRPRWTAAEVAPPPTLEAAFDRIELARRRGEASLPEVADATMSLSRDGAVLTALARNRALAVAEFGPTLARIGITDARAEFDPVLLSTVTFSEANRPSSTGGTTTSRGADGSLRFSQSLPSGTEWRLSGGASRSQSGGSDWGYGGSWSFGVNQQLLRGFGRNVNLVSLRQAENNAEIQVHELRAYVLDLVRQVEAAYWDLVLAKESLEIRRLSLQLSTEQLQLNQELIAVGKLAPDARITAEAEVASRRADLIDAEATVRTRTLSLLRLLNPAQDHQWTLNFSPEDPPEVAAIDLEPNTSTRLADLYRPELAQARLDLVNRDLEVVRTRNGLLPRLTAFASYGRLSSGDSSRHIYSSLDSSRYDNSEAGLTFEMPPFNRSARARHLRAELNLERAEASIQNLEQIIQAEVRQVVIEVQRQWERIPATQRVVKSREAELGVERDRFQVGLSTNLDVLRVERDLIQAKLDEISARVRYIQAVTSLHHAEGTLLDRRGVGIETNKDEMP